MNQFEALCILASNENWCWKLYCTTCGHMHFKYAFLELSKGKSPEDSDWVTHKSENYLHRLLGPIPRIYPESRKDRILKICTKADLHSIADKCKFPDWLGYLGLMLTDMHSSSEVYKLLSTKWASQLKDLVSEYSHIHEKLDSIAKEDSLLNIRDLEECERAINM